jgi:AraC family transcriptional regulator
LHDPGDARTPDTNEKASGVKTESSASGSLWLTHGDRAMTSEIFSNAYARRIDRVVDYICSHLQDELTVDLLSDVAGFSKFHFHRQFSEYTGFTVAEFVRLTRLKRAAYLLVFDPERRVVDIAFEAGFGSHEGFSRAFKEAHNQSPSEFRRAPRWDNLNRERRLPAATRSDCVTPKIVHFVETRVAVLEHRGPHEGLMGSVARFIQWRKSHRDSPARTCRTFGIVYDDPATTEPQAFRFGICGEITHALTANDAGIIEKSIPAGRCAVARHVGSTDAIGRTVHALYADWLPRSGERLREFPVYFHYIKRMPDVSEHEQETDVYLPLL